MHVPDSGHSTHRTPLPCTPGTSDTRSRSSLPAAAHHRTPCPAVSAKIGEGYVQKKGLGAKGAATSPVTKTITKKAPATPATPKKAPAKKAAGSYLFQGTAPSKSGGKFWRVRREGTLLNACCLLVPPTPPSPPCLRADQGGWEEVYHGVRQGWEGKGWVSELDQGVCDRCSALPTHASTLIPPPTSHTGSCLCRRRPPRRRRSSSSGSRRTTLRDDAWACDDKAGRMFRMTRCTHGRDVIYRDYVHICKRNYKETLRLRRLTQVEGRRA